MRDAHDIPQDMPKDALGLVRAGPRRADRTLSVLIPTRGADPSALITALAAGAASARLAPRIEIIVFDDGSEDADIPARASLTLAEAGVEGGVLRSETRVGRAAARNRLADAARGAWLLFLDPDIRPVGDDFLVRWLSVIDQDKPWIAFGRFDVRRGAAGRPAPNALVRAGGAARPHPPGPPARAPARANVSNVLVRCEILAREPFDESYADGGWEAAEWAERAGRRAPILHVNVPAARIEPPDDRVILERYRASAANFARLARAYPALVRKMPAFHAAQVFAAAPGLSALRPLLARAACDRGGFTPARVRELAAELCRASWYGDALR